MIAASLRDCGTEPEVSEEFMIFVISGAMIGRHVLIRGEGKGSSEQVGVFMPDNSFIKWIEEMGVKCESC